MTVALPERGYTSQREQEEGWLATSEAKQPKLVVFFGMLSYKIVAVCDTQKEAEEVLALYSIFATLAAVRYAGQSMSGTTLYGKGMPVKGFTQCSSPHDFDIRTPAQLDRLTRAIIGSYS